MTSPRLRAGAALVAVVASLAACGGDAHDASPRTASAATKPGALVLPAAQRERITVSAVQRTAFAPEVQTTGTVAFDGDQSTQVLAPISGPVTRIVVQPGTHVARGAPLAYVSSPDFAAAVAGYRKAAAAARNAQHIADLDAQLFRNDAIARRDLEQAQTDAVAANADRDAALQQLRALGVDDRTLDALQNDRPVENVQGVIRSPIEGTVVERLVTPGQLIQAGTTPCFTIADLSRMWVMANVFETDLPDVRVGDSARVTTTASPDAFHGTVDNIAAEVDPNTKATAVRIVVRNTGRLLKKDMYVRVGIHSHRARTGLLVPVSAVLRDEDNQPFLFVQSPDGAYARRSVTLGERVDDRYEITAGLAAGEHVVSEGGLFLQFAQSQ
ncbi:MAG TPA: efflux RND transporter periplasmic adaptor subunit [Gemmatimonadaceae bacterium]|nr:efflux RND transporter periplasmic adaptor subunit [Gemmatimonadaceae bacterium]